MTKKFSGRFGQSKDCGEAVIQPVHGALVVNFNKFLRLIEKASSLLGLTEAMRSGRMKGMEMSRFQNNNRGFSLQNNNMQGNNNIFGQNGLWGQNMMNYQGQFQQHDPLRIIEQRLSQKHAIERAEREESVRYLERGIVKEQDRLKNEISLLKKEIEGVKEGVEKKLDNFQQKVKDEMKGELSTFSNRLKSELTDELSTISSEFQKKVDSKMSTLSKNIKDQNDKLDQILFNINKNASNSP